MCGIIGVFGRKDALPLVRKGMKILVHRGTDGKGIVKVSNGIIGHMLHAIVSNVKQPFKGKGVFAANCEIYNWKELSSQYAFNARNDAELLFFLIEKFGVNQQVLAQLDGVYAFLYYRCDKVWVARDILGVKPVWYSESDGFAVCSEKKALLDLGYDDVKELNPRKIVCYDKKAIEVNRPFFKLFNINDSYPEIKKMTYDLLLSAVKKRIPEKKLGILFSGGVDSMVLARICYDLGKKATLYTAAVNEPGMRIAPDLLYARKAARSLNLPLKEIIVSVADLPKLIEIVAPIIESSNVTKIGVALPFYLCAKQAKKDQCKVLFSGLGSEEIFAGYERHKNSNDVNLECMQGLKQMYERDLYRDDCITMHHTLELRLPFLDKGLVSYALSIPAEHKLNGSRNKIVLRDIAGQRGISKVFFERKKDAAQYGSNFDRAIAKCAKKEGFRKKSMYLDQFYVEQNVRLCALVSGGKDSIYAMHVMNDRNYPIVCMVSIQSENPDSYMYHTPAIDLVKLQAESMGIDLIMEKTKGVKEKELAALTKALRIAKKKYGIEGVVTGAVFSTYQRDRVIRICEELGLKTFNPLWHKDQLVLLHELLDNKFKVMIVKIAAEGLDEKWLGHVLDMDMVKELERLNKKIGMHAAGEGGEFETLVLDAPMFRKKLSVKGSAIMDGECTGLYDVEEAVIK